MAVAPGAVPEAVDVSIVNQRTAESVEPPVKDGGFDPVAIAALAGDTLSVTFALPDQRTVLARTVAPLRRRPRVVRISPARGRTDVAINATISVVFSEPIDRSTLNGATVRLLRGTSIIAGVIRPLPGSEVAVEFVPDVPLAPAAEYQLVLSSEIRDLAGDALEGLEPAGFTTIGGTASPQGTGSLAVRTTTTGSKPDLLDPDGYGVIVDGRSPLPIGTNDLITIDGLSWGLHNVGLVGLAGGCAVTLPPMPRQVLMSQEVSPSFSVTFTIVCETPASPIPDPPPQLTGRLVFVSMRDGNEEIYAVNPDGSGIERLTDNLASDRDPAWSPDGTRIAFTSTRDGEAHIYVMNADGSGIGKRTAIGSWNESPAWSPDGREIAFSSLRDGNVGIYVMDAGGESIALRQVGHPRGWNAYPAWSPDGESIAFTSDWNAFDFVYDVHVAAAAGTGITPILTGPFNESLYYFQPAWSPDGTRIAAVTCGWGWTYCYPGSSIVIANADGSGVNRILDGSGFARPAWSPDGTAIAYAARTCPECTAALHYTTPAGTSSGLIVVDGYSPSWR